MTLKQLLKVHGKIQWREADATSKASGIFMDSRQVQAQGVYVAVRGTQSDGHTFLGDAIQRGAAVVVVEDVTAVPSFFRGAVCEVLETRLTLQQLSQRFYGRPGDTMKSVAVTGTNGKTSFSYILEALLASVQAPCGVIGTIDHHLKDKAWSTALTTPDPITLQKRLVDFRDGGAEAFVIEASSHALKQKRLQQGFDLCVFSNFSRDHLDYHAGEEDYFQSKALLFGRDYIKEDGDSLGLVNGDDPAGHRVSIIGERECLTFGAGRNHDFGFEIISERPEGTEIKAFFPQAAPWVFQSPLIGKFNVYNVISALAACYLLGYSWQKASQGLRKFGGIPGRLQPIANDRGIHAFVDFAHTDEALRNVLVQLRAALKGTPGSRLICVFGCGGDRDRGKRRFMGKVARELSDITIVTSDNPRNEAPRQIIDDILGDITMVDGQVIVQEDRRLAIGQAVGLAHSGDIVVVCGKGHEKTQIVGDEHRPFSDPLVLKEFFQSDD